MRDIKKPIRDALFNIEKIQERINNKTFENFTEDFDLNRVIKYYFIELCEALSQIRKIEESNILDFNEMIYLANKLKHNYWIDRDSLVFDCIRKLDLIKKELEKILKNI